ncbi:MAG TPA: hypothetical protein VNO22_08965 [Planctomycetota bacterium]|nr:hypothetical protein [Planctomycetota bacterium]
MSLRAFFQGALVLGCTVAVVGAGALAALHLAAPRAEILPRLEGALRHALFGFFFAALFALVSGFLDALRPAAPARPPEAVPPPAAPAPQPSRAPAPRRLESLYHEMKVYVDLEMWELALEKANAILKEFPGTREAELVARNINEIRWKAEPKFLARTEPLSEDQQRELREKGLAQMYQHVRTYMDLEMWELARQKALAILKNFPDAPEALELMKVYDTLEKKAQEASAPGAGTPE